MQTSYLGALSVCVCLCNIASLDVCNCFYIAPLLYPAASELLHSTPFSVQNDDHVGLIRRSRSYAISNARTLDCISTTATGLQGGNVGLI